MCFFIKKKSLKVKEVRITLFIYTFRGDALERSRKEVEHRASALEESVDFAMRNLREAKNLTDETQNKTESAALKTERLIINLAKARKRAEAAERQVKIYT